MKLQKAAEPSKNISIHALREEGDDVSVVDLDETAEFLSTPSARRATRQRRIRGVHKTISIHALREEGDAYPAYNTRHQHNFYPRPPRGGRHSAVHRIALPAEFLSTPSARRATDVIVYAVTYRDISIHALREEGDIRSKCSGKSSTPISIHALREEGDTSASCANSASL